MLFRHGNGFFLERCSHGVVEPVHESEVGNQRYDLDNLSVVWYPMPAWDMDWAGDFTVWNDENEIVRSVAIKPNRLVIFDGNPPHAARPLSRFATERRVACLLANSASACPPCMSQIHGSHSDVSTMRGPMTTAAKKPSSVVRQTDRNL
jgi:hypothetical protein